MLKNNQDSLHQFSPNQDTKYFKYQFKLLSLTILEGVKNCCHQILPHCNLATTKYGFQRPSEKLEALHKY